MVILTYLTTTACALEYVETIVDISYTEFEFQIPMSVEDKGVTVCYTSTYTPTLIAVVGEVLVWSSQE